ncbi:hypothetical protein BpHYR1_052851 [Brachionus plicatilis]|uniref:Uncharacterized protein n=1 Tax=Brachionus plicatilis TaxID=10195 RepID=A0A3M7RJ57_BRAPC|nr:hypothetical protein BpHYR1_052851 [Brachionus plicatilis]
MEIYCKIFCNATKYPELKVEQDFRLRTQNEPKRTLKKPQKNLKNQKEPRKFFVKKEPVISIGFFSHCLCMSNQTKKLAQILV